MSVPQHAVDMQPGDRMVYTQSFFGDGCSTNDEEGIHMPLRLAAAFQPACMLPTHLLLLFCDWLQTTGNIDSLTAEEPKASCLSSSHSLFWCQKKKQSCAYAMSVLLRLNLRV